MAHDGGSRSKSAMTPPPPLRGGGVGRSRFPRWGLLVAIGLLAAGFGLVPGTANAAVMPSNPTGVTATVGDTEATISWSSGGTGNGGSCSSDEYYVSVYDATKQSFPEVAQSLPLDAEEGTSWYIDELAPSTRHYVTVEAYGYECDEYSEWFGAAFFTTNASTSTSDPSAPGTRKKRAPARVRDLAVDTSTSGQITITWKKPIDIGTKRSKRCAYSAQASGHATQSIEYNYLVENLYGSGTDITDSYFRSSAATLSKTVTGIPAGTGYRLRVTVTAYSDQCKYWSNSREYEWWSS